MLFEFAIAQVCQAEIARALVQLCVAEELGLAGRKRKNARKQNLYERRLYDTRCNIIGRSIRDSHWCFHDSAGAQRCFTQLRRLITLGTVAELRCDIS